MADEYTVRRVLRELSECAGLDEPSDEKVYAYRRQLRSVENAQLIAALPILRPKAKRSIPTPGQILAEAQKQKYTLEPVKMKLITLTGEVIEATFTGSNRPQVCKKCGRVMGGRICYLCDAGS